MSVLNLEADVIKEMEGDEGLDFQARLVQNLFEGKGIISTVSPYKEIVEGVIVTACRSLQEIGIKRETIDKIKSGKVCVLDEVDKAKVIEEILEIIEITDYFNDPQRVQLNQDKEEDNPERKRMLKALNEDVKVCLVGNLVQIFCTKVRSYAYFENIYHSNQTIGLTFPFPTLQEGDNPTGLIINVIREQIFTDSTAEIANHELWHAFDKLRFKLIGERSPYLVLKHAVMNERLSPENAIHNLIKSKPEEFLYYVFGENFKLPRFGVYRQRLNDLNWELPAFLASKINKDGKCDISSNEIINALIAGYIFKSKIKLDELIQVSFPDENGRLVLDKGTVTLLASRPVGIKGAQLTNEVRFIEYFSENEDKYPLSKRKMKAGMDIVLVNYYQEVLDLLYNDQNSPIVQIRKELQRAIDAFMVRNRKVGPYRALVEMSLLPFNRWAAYVRSKESEESKDLLQ